VFSWQPKQKRRCCLPGVGDVVINTPGWIAGLGLETLRATCEAMECRVALQLHDPQSTMASLTLGKDTVVYPLIARVGPSPPINLASSALRDWRMCDYFSGSPGVGLRLKELCICIHGGKNVPDDLVLMALLETVVVLLSAPSFKGREGRFCDCLPLDGKVVGLAFVQSVVVDGPEGPVLELISPCRSFDQVNVVARVNHETPTILRQAFYNKNPAVSKKKHYAAHAMTGSKFILRSKDYGNS
jgi:hypothetical protein